MSKNFAADDGAASRDQEAVRPSTRWTMARPRILKLLRSPRIDFMEQIPPDCVAWRASTTTLFLLGSYLPQIVSKFQHWTSSWPLIFNPDFAWCGSRSMTPTASVVGVMAMELQVEACMWWRSFKGSNIFQIPCNCQQLCSCQFILYGESIETSNADL